MSKRIFWTSGQIRKLRKLYPHKPTAQVAKALRKPVAKVYAKVWHLGLKKTARYLASPAACRLRRGDNVGKAFRFKKGLVPWNLGKRGYMGANRTSFKTGQKPWTWKPIGHERVTREGILERKMADTGVTRRDYRPVHVMAWEKANGRRVPKGRIVIFRDHNRSNFDPSNLEAITRAENMRRNTYHRYPKEIARLIQLRGALNRQINKREGRRVQQDRGS